MDILALARVRKDQEGSKCANPAAFQIKISAPLPGVVCVCLRVQSLEPFAVHRERAGEGRTPEQSSVRVQLGPGTGTEPQMAESQIPGQQGQNPKWQITSGSGSSENGRENP